MLNGLAEHCDLVHLAAVAGRDHGGELIDEAVHFLPPPLLNLAVRLPADNWCYTRKNSKKLRLSVKVKVFVTLTDAAKRI